MYIPVAVPLNAHASILQIYMYTCITTSIYLVREAKQPRTGGIKVQNWTIPIFAQILLYQACGDRYNTCTYPTPPHVLLHSYGLQQFGNLYFNCISSYFYVYCCTYIYIYIYTHVHMYNYVYKCIYHVGEAKQPRTGGIKMRKLFPEPSVHKFYSTRLVVTGILQVN